MGLPCKWPQVSIYLSPYLSSSSFHMENIRILNLIFNILHFWIRQLKCCHWIYKMPYCKIFCFTKQMPFQYSIHACKIMHNSHRWKTFKQSCMSFSTLMTIITHKQSFSGIFQQRWDKLHMLVKLCVIVNNSSFSQYYI